MRPEKKPIASRPRLAPPLVPRASSLRASPSSSSQPPRSSPSGRPPISPEALQAVTKSSPMMSPFERFKHAQRYADPMQVRNLEPLRADDPDLSHLLGDSDPDEMRRAAKMKANVRDNEYEMQDLPRPGPSSERTREDGSSAVNGTPTTFPQFASRAAPVPSVGDPGPVRSAVAESIPAYFSDPTVNLALKKLSIHSVPSDTAVGSVSSDGAAAQDAARPNGANASNSATVVDANANVNANVNANANANANVDFNRRKKCRRMTWGGVVVAIVIAVAVAFVLGLGLGLKNRHKHKG